MKYFISINQAGFIDYFGKGVVDYIDAVLLTYIRDWFSNPRRTENEGYVWINLRHCIEEFPILPLNTKGAVSNRFKKLSELGLIILRHDQDKRLFVKLTDLYFDIAESRRDSLQGVHTGEQGVHTGEQGVHTGEQGVNVGEQGVHTGEHSSYNQYPNNQYPNTKSYNQYPKKEEGKTKQVLFDSQVQEIYDFWKSTFPEKKHRLDETRAKVIKKALKVYSIDEMKNAIKGCSWSSWHVNNGKVDLAMIFKDSPRIDNFIDIYEVEDRKRPKYRFVAKDSPEYIQEQEERKKCEDPEFRARADAARAKMMEHLRDRQRKERLGLL